MSTGVTGAVQQVCPNELHEQYHRYNVHKGYRSSTTVMKTGLQEQYHRCYMISITGIMSTGLQKQYHRHLHRGHMSSTTGIMSTGVTEAVYHRYVHMG